MDIRSLHDYLATTLLANLSITQPHAASMKRVYKYVPPRREALSDWPCALLTYEQRPVEFRPSMLHKPYSVHIQLIAGPTDVEADVQADVASAFLEALVQALSADLTLGGNVSVVNGFRGETPETLVVLEWARRGFVGVDLWLDVTMTEAKSHAA